MLQILCKRHVCSYQIFHDSAMTIKIKTDCYDYNRKDKNLKYV